MMYAFTYAKFHIDFFWSSSPSSSHITDVLGVISVKLVKINELEYN
jgi:hypothetical protein